MSYPGPPQSPPPPPGWRPPVVTRPAPPRSLPPQDHAALDRQERTARRITLLVGVSAGLVMLVTAGALIGSLVT